MTSKKGLDWAANRKFFVYVEPKVWKWFEESHLEGSQSIRLLVLAGPGHASRIVRALADVTLQSKAGFPYPIEPVAVCTENLLTAEGLEKANAAKRVYKFFAQRCKGGLLRFLDYDPFIRYATSAARWCEKLEVPLFYGNPHPNPDKGDPDIWEQILELAPSDGAGPFHGFLSGPWKHYIDRHIRQCAGEVIDPESRDVFQLPGARFTFGLGFGFHPNLACGGAAGLEFMAGSEPADYFLDRWVTEARLCLMGVGPKKMDRPEFWGLDGPVHELGVNYPG